MQDSAWSRAKRDSKVWLLDHIATWVLAFLLPGGGSVIAIWLIPSDASGGLITLFGFLGGLAGLCLLGMGVLAWNLFKAPYRQRDEARQSVQELNELLRPKFELSIESSEPIRGGRPLEGQPQSYFWRLNVKNKSKATIQNCYATIIGLYGKGQSDNQLNTDENWPIPPHNLPWARGAGNPNDDYRADFGVDETKPVDYFVLPDTSSQYLTIPMHPNSSTERPYYHNYRMYQREYELEIAVSSRDVDMEPSIIRMSFKWEGGCKANITEHPQAPDKEGFQP